MNVAKQYPALPKLQRNYDMTSLTAGAIIYSGRARYLVESPYLLQGGMYGSGVKAYILINQANNNRFSCEISVLGKECYTAIK